MTLSFYWNLKHRKLSTVVILFQVHLQCHLWCEVGGSWHRSRWADGWDWICPVTDRNPVPREQVNQRHVPGAPQQHPAQDRQTPHRNLCKCCLLMEYTVSCTLGLKMVIYMRFSFLHISIHSSFWISVKKISYLDACLENGHQNEIFIYSSLHVCFNTPVYQFIFFILHNWELSLFSLHI